MAVASHMTNAEPIKKFYISKVTNQGIEPETSRSREGDGEREECGFKKIASVKKSELIKIAPGSVFSVRLGAVIHL